MSQPNKRGDTLPATQGQLLPSKIKPQRKENLSPIQTGATRKWDRQESPTNLQPQHEQLAKRVVMVMICERPGWEREDEEQQKKETNKESRENRNNETITLSHPQDNKGRTFLQVKNKTEENSALIWKIN